MNFKASGGMLAIPPAFTFLRCLNGRGVVVVTSVSVISSTLMFKDGPDSRFGLSAGGPRLSTS